MAGGINVGRWLRKVTGKPVTVGSVAELLATIRADTTVKESFEARIKRNCCWVQTSNGGSATCWRRRREARC